MSRSIKQYGNHDKKDFCCPCCGQFGVAPESLNKLLQAEKIAGFDFEILSSYRCLSFNKQSGKKETSSHIVGNAFNINCCDLGKNGKPILNKRKAFLIVSSCMQVGFTRIGINMEKFFIHIDDDLNKRQNQLFIFK